MVPWYAYRHKENRKERNEERKKNKMFMKGMYR